MKALLLATNPLQPLIPSLVHTHSLRKHFLDSGVPWGGGHFLPVQVVSTFRQTMGTVCVVNPISSMRSVGLEFCEPFLSTHFQEVPETRGGRGQDAPLKRLQTDLGASGPESHVPTGVPGQAGPLAEAQRAEWGLCYAPVPAPRCLSRGQGQEGLEEVAWQEERRAGCGARLPQPGHLRGPLPGARLETPGGPEEEGGAAFRVT